MNVSKERIIKDDTLIITFSHKSHVERLENEIKDPIIDKEIAIILQDTLGIVKKIKPKNVDNNNQKKQSIHDSHLVKSAQNLGAQIFEKKEVKNE